ncbi:MAG: hypothetical protein ACRD50_15275 [Candidatus Acidiferrales bacterium]
MPFLKISKRIDKIPRLWCKCAAGLLVLALALLASPALRAQDTEQTEDELVASLACGRVVIAVTKDAILIASVENKIEPATRPPVIVPLGTRRAAILLGADIWSVPSSGVLLARLDQELGHLHSSTQLSAPHLQQGEGAEAVELEMLATGLRDRLNEIVAQIHGRLDLHPDEPIVELLIADYVAAYGPEVWLVSYTVSQEPIRGDYYFSSTVARPRFDQLWPPEKGQPHTLLEIQYPSDASSETLLSLLQKNDPRLENISSADAVIAETFRSCDSRKIESPETLQFLRAALDRVTPPGAGEAIALISEKTGFEWILEPPKEKEIGPQKNRPPSAPTLIKPSN